MSQHEKGPDYSILGVIGTVEDKDGTKDAIGVEILKDIPKEAVLADIENKTGIRLEVLAEITDGQVKHFGFSGSWKGSTWIPEGPRPNWIDPKKSN